MNIKERQKEIIKEFEKFDSFIEKYNYLIHLGKKAPSINPKYKTEENLIKGCQVNTWYHSEFRDGKVFYEIESASEIINGIIFLLVRVLSGEKPENIKNAEIYFIDKIGLKGEISPFRENSLWRVINKMKEDADFYSGSK